MKRQLILIILALVTTVSFAQHDEQVTVEGKYRPKANKVNKMALQPETPQPSFTLPSTEVVPKETTRKFVLDLEKIAPTGYAAKNDNLVTPAKNFLMAGVGTRLSPIFLYKHNSMLTKTFGLGVGIKHNSSWLDIKDYAPSSYMNNAFDINLSSSAISGMQLEGGVYYKNDMFHYYGVNLSEMFPSWTEEEIEAACPSQTYNTIGTHLGLASTSTRVGELSHRVGLDYRYTFDDFDAKEHFVNLEYGLGFTQNWWGDKSHPQKVGLNLAFQDDVFKFGTNNTEGDQIASSTNNRLLIKVNPYFEMSDAFYRLHLGVMMDGATQMETEDSFLAIRPDLSGSLYVLDNKLEFYAGLNGGRKLVTFGETIEENPFYCSIPAAEWLVQNVKLGFDGGVRTNIAEMVDLHLGVRYRHVDNDPLYQQHRRSDGVPAVWNSYGLEYDEIKTVSVLANLRLKLRSSLTADLGFAYNHYDLKWAEYAWYHPATEGKLKLTYDVNDKLALNTAFLYQGGRYAKIWNDGPYWKTKYPPVYDIEKLNDVFDLSIGADYKVNDQLTAFALIDNVACQKYQLYYNYPVTGIQFYAGVKLRF